MQVNKPQISAFFSTANMQDYPNTTAHHAPPPFSLDDQDESVRIAVRALGAMRNSTGMSQSQSQASSVKSCEYFGSTFILCPCR